MPPQSFGCPGHNGHPETDRFPVRRRISPRLFGRVHRATRTPLCTSHLGPEIGLQRRQRWGHRDAVAGESSFRARSWPRTDPILSRTTSMPQPTATRSTDRIANEGEVPPVHRLPSSDHAVPVILGRDLKARARQVQRLPGDFLRCLLFWSPHWLRFCVDGCRW